MRILSTLAILGALALPSAPVFALEPGEQAPCVVLNHLAPDGTESEHCIREPKAEGQYKILEFFSATCSDCAKNLPKVTALAAKTDGVATTRLVGIDRSESLLREYVKSHADLIRFEVALDTARDAKNAYGVVQTPTLFVLDSQDKVVFRHAGVLADEDLAAIEAIVRERR